MKKGKFIVLEGGEGAGKSSVVKYLQERMHDAVFTREPGGTPYAEEIRELALTSAHAATADAQTLFLLMWAARKDHVERLIRPALAEGKTVICDRFDSSTFAYQVVAGGARELEELFFTMRQSMLGDMLPDQYIYLDVDPELGLARKHDQAQEELNVMEKKGLEFQKHVREGMMEFFEKSQASKALIDANVELAPMCEAVEKALSDVLGRA